MNILLYANWKMNLGPLDSIELIKKLTGEHLNKKVEVSYFPSIISLYAVFKQMEGTDDFISGKTSLGAQNCDWREQGPVTGETSSSMIKDICSKILVGHSERRQLFGESEAIINKKIAMNLSQGIISVLCVGEAEFYEGGASEANRVLEDQLMNALRDIDLSGHDSSELVVAYEPIWAIGTGNAATPTIANERCVFIKDRLIAKYGREVAEAIPILYGGSVSENNARSFLQCEGINGLLIGGASLHSQEFKSIIQVANGVADEKLFLG